MSGVPANRYVIFVLVSALGLVADLATKSWMFDWPALDSGQIFWVWPGHAGFQRSLNEGALFGLGQGKVGLFAAVSIAAAVFIPTWLFLLGGAKDRWLNLALASVMAGVLGNLYDRLGLHELVRPPYDPRAGQAVYAVRDWILLQWNSEWTWPNFNIADSMLVVGACALVLHSWKNPQPTANASSEASSSGQQ